MNCIKCGKEIPDGELFCVECSLNPTAPLFGESKSAVRYPAPKGRMQTPQPVKRAAPQPMGPMQPQIRTKNSRGLKWAFAIVTLLLAAVLGLGAWQYGGIAVQRARLASKEADLTLRERDMEELNQEVKDLEADLEAAQQTIADRELRIQDLEGQLSGSQSSESQSQYDLTTKQAELERLVEENQQLLELADDLEAQVKDLTTTQEAMTQALQAAESYKTKAEFMDSYVVFVENNKTGYYHTYDCQDFTKSNFWAYSRKLAESNGYKPCPVCGGMP